MNLHASIFTLFAPFQTSVFLLHVRIDFFAVFIDPAINCVFSTVNLLSPLGFKPYAPVQLGNSSLVFFRAADNDHVTARVLLSALLWVRIGLLLSLLWSLFRPSVDDFLPLLFV
ncbi:MAG: hypothetical protein Q4G66_12310 [bacterium]|nr:hypothetical protein [bacterium]